MVRGPPPRDSHPEHRPTLPHSPLSPGLGGQLVPNCSALDRARPELKPLAPCVGCLVTLSLTRPHPSPPRSPSHPSTSALRGHRAARLAATLGPPATHTGERPFVLN